MINSINIYATDFGNIELSPELINNLTFELVPMGRDDELREQPKPLPQNPKFWAYIDKRSSELEDEHWGA